MDATAILTIASVSLAAFAIYYQVKVFSFWKSRGINGPMPWPFFGTNIYYFFKTKTDLEADWHRRYGHSYGCYDGFWPILRTTDNELIKRVWIKDFSSFTDRYNLTIHDAVAKKWLFWSEGDHWANQRALISPMFTSAKMRSMLTTIKQCTETLLDEIARNLNEREDAKHNSRSRLNEKEETFTEKSALISKDELMSYTLDSVAQSLFGLKLNTYADKSSEFYKRAFAFAEFSVKRFMVYLLLPLRVSRLLKFDLTPYSQYEYFDKLTMCLLKERRQNNCSADKPKPANDIIQMLMEAKIPDEYQNVYTDEDGREAHYNDNISKDKLEELQRDQTKRSKYFRSFDDLEIRGQTTFLFLAGFETTSSSLSFCLYELAHDQRVQEEVYEEIREALDGKSFDQMELSQITGLKKLDAVVSEALRLHGVVTENNRIVTDKDGRTVMVNGKPVHLPHRCVISFNAHLIHRHQDYWQEPARFDISRFYRENKDQINSCTYLPFGVGPRNCAGMRLALLNIKTLLMNLMYNCKFYPGPNSKRYPPSYKQHAFFLQLTSSDIRVEFRRHSRHRS